VYSREIGDSTVLTLSASGWTYDNTFVLFDYETESLWYHLAGEDGLRCVSGFYADEHLDEFPSSFIRWNVWKFSNPTTQFLKYP
jgi:hypothetical protein